MLEKVESIQWNDVVRKARRWCMKCRRITSGDLLGSIYQNWIYAIVGYFSLLANVNFVALNTCIHGFVWVLVFNFLNIYLAVELLNYMIMLFNLLRCHQIFFYRGSTFFCFHQQFMRILFSSHSHQYLGISFFFFFFNYSHPSGFGVVYLYGFDLHFSNDWWY